ncbi:MAG: Ig-like domain-containing protein, partial [Gemmatimonadales bacterium]|nr:Ig-like domain-containing protein [Gemmatimonadales bacterium]
MAKIVGSRVPRLVARLAALTGCVLAVSYCGEQGRFGGITPPGGDTENPVVTVTFPGGAADTVVDITDSLKFTVRVTDNAQVAAIQVRVAGLGGFTLDTTVLDTTNTTATTDVTRSFTVPLPANAAGQRLAITATAADVTGNTATTTINVVVEDPQPPVITVRQPGSGASVAAGATLTVVVKATDPSGIDSMGVRLFQTRDALGQPRTITQVAKPRYSPRVESKTDTFQLTVPDTLNPGTYTVHAFAFDGSPSLNDTTSADVSIQVADTLAPFGTFLSPPQDSQVVAGDSLRITFRAQDRAGLDSVVFRGFQQRGDSALGTDQQILRFNVRVARLATQSDSVVLTRILDPVVSDSTPSDSVFLEATIFDVGGNRTKVLLRIRIVQGPFVRVSSPANGSRQPVGVPLAITLIGRDPDSVRILGFIARGVAPGADTLAVIAPPLQVQDTITRTLTVPASTALGVDTITPFGRDKLGKAVLGTPIVVSFEDRQKPTVTINLPNVANFPVTVGDSVRVNVRVEDNRGVAGVVFAGVALRGVDSLGTGTTVTRYVSRSVTLAQATDTTFTRYLRFLPGDSTSENVQIIVTAQDSSGNIGADTAQVRIVNGPVVSIVRPSDGSFTSVGKSVAIEVSGVDPQGVRILGWRATGVVTAQDSVIAIPSGGALPDALTFIDTLTIPVGTPLGNIVITPFGVDSLNDPSGTVGGVSITVQSVTGDVTPPLVTFTVDSRVEVDDSISVRATDASGITWVGFVVRQLGSSAIVRADSVLFSGALTDVTQRFQLTLDSISTYPRQVTIEAFARDAVVPTSNRGVSTTGTTPIASPAATDTLTVVAGKTIALPLGGQIGDAIYNRNRNELYLSNTTLNRLEIFQLNDSTFAPGIPIGSRPVGIALWPRDTLGSNADTVIVANSGGTNLSIVDVSAARVERRRHRLPNYLVQTVKTSTNAGGGLDIIVTEFDLSDRPLYVGATCRAGAIAACDSVLAVYSTTPTPAQPAPFTNRGYMAWENLRALAGAPSGHLFYEVGTASSAVGTDTVQIIAVRDTAPGLARRDTILGAGVGIIAGLTQLA